MLDKLNCINHTGDTPMLISMLNNVKIKIAECGWLTGDNSCKN